MSSYAPEWVKENQDRFARAQDKDGNSIEALSTLSAANRNADAKAFAALMRHIREVDTQRRVIMIQVENEVGRFTDTRDRSEAANEAFAGAVPKELLDHISSHNRHHKQWPNLPPDALSTPVLSPTLVWPRNLARAIHI
jgi:S-formylglutathione hydrolase FrmB